jgi:hypothetical protein
VKPYLKELRAQKGHGNDRSELELFELEIKRLCTMIDVRIREFAGMVEFYHSEYYADERVVQAIAKFLETGVRPSTIS